MSLQDDTESLRFLIGSTADDPVVEDKTVDLPDALKQDYSTWRLRIFERKSSRAFVVSCVYRADDRWFLSVIHQGYSEPLARMIFAAPVTLLSAMKLATWDAGIVDDAKVFSEACSFSRLGLQEAGVTLP